MEAEKYLSDLKEKSWGTGKRTGEIERLPDSGTVSNPDVIPA
jgi:hypothetical protein